MKSKEALSRRGFLRHTTSTAAAVAAVSQFPFVLTSHAAPDDPIRIGVIGCGGRGTGAVLDALGAATQVIYPSSGFHTEDVDPKTALKSNNITVTALADVFPDRVARCREQLKKLGINVPDEMCFTGFEGYKKLLAVPEINYVIQATPPHFRPAHVYAAIEAGKNVFMEKPGGVDGPGVRTLLAAGELARQKNLGIVAGTQRRHHPGYIETIKRIHDGMIGEIVECRAYWNGGVIWTIEKTPQMSELEWQLRNWNYFTWAGGDHIVEQHVHNLDVINWIMNDHPVKAFGMGGRQVRQHPIHGHIYDHFAVEYEYANGVRLFSQCRQMNGCEGKVEEAVVGTKGKSNCAQWITVKGGDPWRYRENSGSAYQIEHQDLIASIRAGKPLNEAKNIAESTLTGIMGREAAYSGQTIEWEKALTSKTRLGPDKYELGDLPFPEVPTPGKHRLV